MDVQGFSSRWCALLPFSWTFLSNIWQDSQTAWPRWELLLYYSKQDVYTELWENSIKQVLTPYFHLSESRDVSGYSSSDAQVSELDSCWEPYLMSSGKTRWN